MVQKLIGNIQQVDKIRINWPPLQTLHVKITIVGYHQTTLGSLFTHSIVACEQPLLWCHIFKCFILICSLSLNRCTGHTVRHGECYIRALYSLRTAIVWLQIMQMVSFPECCFAKWLNFQSPESSALFAMLLVALFVFKWMNWIICHASGQFKGLDHSLRVCTPRSKIKNLTRFIVVLN